MITIIMPHDISLERSILSAYLHGWGDDYDRVEPVWFYLPSNRIIMEVIRDIQFSGQDVDLPAVTIALHDSGALSRVGGAVGVTEIIFEPVPGSSAHAINRLKALYDAREEIKTCWFRIDELSEGIYQ